MKLISRNKIHAENVFHEASNIAGRSTSQMLSESSERASGMLTASIIAMEYLPKGSLEDEAKGGYVDLNVGTQSHDRRSSGIGALAPK